MNNRKISYIILNDLRATPIVSVFKLRKSINNSKIIAHESIFTNNEYADYTPLLWKSILKYILVFIFKIKIIHKGVKDLQENEEMGFFSSLCSITEDSSPNETKYPKAYKSSFNLALGSKDIVNFLNEKSINSVFVFNGRTASSYLITKYCVKSNIKIFYYEFAGHGNGFRLYPVPPHADGKLGEIYLNQFKKGIYDFHNMKIAENFFKKEKLNSIYKKSTTEIDDKNYDIVIFLGSDFEYTSVDPEICYITWLGNLNFCKLVIDKFGIHRKYTIRCHPNSSNDPNWRNIQDDLLNGLKKISSNIEIISPKSKLDSHFIIKNSNIVATDLSTISLDSILLGQKTDINGNTSIKLIYEDKFYNKIFNNDMKNNIMKPFSLVHNLFVFRYSFLEKITYSFIFVVNRVFEKIKYVF
jgi:hypothetical protein